MSAILLFVFCALCLFCPILTLLPSFVFNNFKYTSLIPLLFLYYIFRVIFLVVSLEITISILT